MPAPNWPDLAHLFRDVLGSIHRLAVPTSAATEALTLILIRMDREADRMAAGLDRQRAEGVTLVNAWRELQRDAAEAEQALAVYSRPDTGGPFAWPPDDAGVDMMPRAEWREMRSERTDLEPGRDGRIVVQVHDGAALIEHLPTGYGVVGPRTELRPMVDDERDILDRIDDDTLCTWCASTLDGSVSDTFCGQACQTAWYAQSVDQLPAAPDPWQTWADQSPYGDDSMAAEQPVRDMLDETVTPF